MRSSQEIFIKFKIVGGKSTTSPLGKSELGKIPGSFTFMIYIYVTVMQLR